MTFQEDIKTKPKTNFNLQPISDKYYIVIPHYQFRNTKIIEYGKIETNYTKHKTIDSYNDWIKSNNELLEKLKTAEQKKKEALQKSIKYQGTFSQGAKKNIRRAIDILLQTNPKKRIYNTIKNKWQNHTITFLTLTIPTYKELHPSYTHKHLLQPLLDYLRKSHNLKFYIWKIEYQERGQIHYHLTFPNWINLNQLKDKWNYLLNTNNLMTEYKEKYNNINPPSIHIGKVKNIKNFGEYLEKEFNKSQQNNNDKQAKAITNYMYQLENYNTNQKIKKTNTKPPTKPLSFKTWDCSLNIKSSKLFTLELTEDIDISMTNAIVFKHPNATYNKMEHCIIKDFKQEYIQDVLPQYEQLKYEDWKKEIINYKRQRKK